MWSTISAGPEQTRLLGLLLGRSAYAGMVVLLSGDLGAGQTCFAQGVARGLDVPANIPVTSPSYSLMNIYSGRLPLYHFDLYRLHKIDDLGDLGFDEFAEGQGLTLVEWADRVSEQLAASLQIEIARTSETERTLRFLASDDLGKATVLELEKNWEKAGLEPS